MSSPPSFLSQLKQQREAEMQSVKIAKQLAKTAEKKLAQISTALDQYASEYKKEFPITYYEKKTPETVHWKSHTIAQIIPHLKMSIGIPNDSGYYTLETMPIIENRIVTCQRYYDRATKTRDYSFVCQTVTSPTKYFEINKDPTASPLNIHNQRIERGELDNSVKISLKSNTEMQLEPLMVTALQKKVNVIMQSSDYWHRANIAIDDFQTRLLQVTSQSKQKIEEYSDYLSKQTSQASFTLNSSSNLALKKAEIMKIEHTPCIQNAELRHNIYETGDHLQGINKCLKATKNSELIALGKAIENSHDQLRDFMNTNKIKWD